MEGLNHDDFTFDGNAIEQENSALEKRVTYICLDKLFALRLLKSLFKDYEPR